MSELTVYVYPWDVLDTGVDQIVEWAQGTGVDRLAVATAYHSAEYLAPRAVRDVHRVVEPNVAHLPLREFTGALTPRPGSLASEHPDLYQQLADRVRDAGIALTGWTVALHNSDLAGLHPETATRNCFGDRGAHGLCPSNPDAQRYGVELVGAVAATGWFDELMVESLSFLLVPHAQPHELSGVPFDLLTRTLLSLCYCDHCAQRGQERGLDVERLRRWTARTLRRHWTSPLAPGISRDGSDLLGLLWSVPDLREYLTMRCDVVTDLLGHAVRAAAEYDATVAPAGAGWARPAALGLLEGIDIAALRGGPPRSMLLPYYSSLADMARDLDFATTVSDPARFQVLQTLWSTHHPGGRDDLLAKVALAQQAGFDQFGLYNYASATEQTFAWINEVAAQIHQP